MARRMIVALGASVALALTLSACSGDSGSDAELPTTVVVDTDGNELRDLTYTLDFSIQSDKTWPAAVMRHTISSFDDLLKKMAEYPELNGWVVNIATNDEGAMVKELPFREVEKYGQELCERYPHEDLAQYTTILSLDGKILPAEIKASLEERFTE